MRQLAPDPGLSSFDGRPARAERQPKGIAVEISNALCVRLTTHNRALEKILKTLGFEFIGNVFYEPTGLMHPSYVCLESRTSRDRKFESNFLRR